MQHCHLLCCYRSSEWPDEAQVFLDPSEEEVIVWPQPSDNFQATQRPAASGKSEYPQEDCDLIALLPAHTTSFTGSHKDFYF